MYPETLAPHVHRYLQPCIHLLDKQLDLLFPATSTSEYNLYANLPIRA